jgi:hypothetical protein
MPSICEAPNLEESWVEYVRTPKQPGSEGRKRRKVSSPAKPHSEKATEKAAAVPSTPAPTPASKPLGINITLARAAINTVLIALILHLLILPELVQQSPKLCQIPSIKALYASCTTTPSPPDTSTTQNNLQSILSSTLQSLSPHTQTLKESEKSLNTLSTHLKSTIPSAHHALDLEFSGSTLALATAIHEYDSLRRDLTSALESLLSTPTPSTKVALQMRRRGEYLERLRAQIRGKAEALSARFSTLDDHLEAVGVVAREAVREPVREKSLFGRYFRVEEEGKDIYETTLLLKRAGGYRVVADEVLWLARQLGSTQ